MKYLGMDFKNYDEFEAWSRNGHVERYKVLAGLFSENPTMELSVAMSDEALILTETFGLTWEQIEDIEAV